MALNLYTGNRQEDLAAQLAKLLQREPLDPMTPEFIVVQSSGMERWLSLELSRHLGLFSGYRFRFPRAAIWDLHRLCLPDDPTTPLDPERLFWEVFARLQEDDLPDEVMRFLELNRSGTERMELASLLSDLFDQYTTYRSAELTSWEQESDTDHWQARLWRRVQQKLTTTPFHHQQPQLLNAILQSSIRDNLPTRITLFGISTLPPAFLQVYEALAHRLDLNLFLLSPSREYWTWLLSRRELARKKQPADQTETGNPLLLSWGRATRWFTERLIEGVDQPVEAWNDPGERTLLTCVQQDLLYAKTRTDWPETDPGDRSLLVHMCHNRLREVEVLHDQLMHLFNRLPDLHPDEIVVMAPDMADWEAVIRMVFDRPEGDPGVIPWRLADKTGWSESSTINALATLLEVLDSNFSVVAVKTLLHLDAVQQQLELTTEDLELIDQWIAEAGIHWGLNADHKAENGAPRDALHSWEFGLDRLISGLIMGDTGNRLMLGVHPLSEVSVPDGRILGALTWLLDQLQQLRQSTAGEHDFPTWVAILNQIMDELFHPDTRTEREERHLRQLLSELQELPAAAGVRGGITLNTLCYWLQRKTAGNTSSAGFISAGVTFCSLQPMRSVPFRVVCLLGMNDDAFPRSDHHPAYSLMKDPRPGDRNRRDEDRYLFLEALLAARDALHISYIGYQDRTHESRPPSLPVAELLEYVGQRLSPGTDDPVLKQHHLQPYHPDYFQPGGLIRSYQTNWQTHIQPDDDQSVPVSASATITRDVSLDELITFYKDPLKEYLRARYQVWLPRDEAEISELEPIQLNGLEHYHYRQLLSREMDAQSQTEVHQLLLQRGQSPLAGPGEYLYRKEGKAIRNLLDKAGEFGVQAAPRQFKVDLQDFVLSGQLVNVRSTVQVIVHTSKKNVKKLLNAWIEHLVFQILQGDDSETVLLTMDDTSVKKDTFSPVQNPQGVLSQLLTIREKGLQKVPQLFPEISYSFVKELKKKGGTPEKAQSKALRDWVQALKPDNYNDHWDWRFIYGEQNPISQEFMDLAEQIFVPMHLSILGLSKGKK